MPTYEYHCDACEADYELEQRITEDAKKKCIRCGKSKARRLIGRGNFILKGGGWYADLYSSSSSSSSATSSSSGSKSTTESKTTAAPAKKPSSGSSEGSKATATA